MKKPTETFSFDYPLFLEGHGNRMSSSEVHNSIFIIMEENKFKYIFVRKILSKGGVNLSDETEK